MRQLLFLSLLLLIVSPAVSGQSRDDLPCASRSAECVRMLSDLALKNSAELRTLDQAIAYQKRRGWSSWLNADGLNPLSSLTARNGATTSVWKFQSLPIRATGLLGF